LAGQFGEWAPAMTSDPSQPVQWAGPERPLAGLQLLAPVQPNARVLAAGATYAKHVAGLGLQMPKQPAAFYKGYSALIGPEDEIQYPALTSQLDYEGELVAVVGSTRDDRAEPLILAVLGYTIGNEVSARDLQFGGSVTGMDIFSGKSLDRTSPIGPWIVTREEFGDEHPDLDLRTIVDGEVRQHDRTGSMAWGVGELVKYVDLRLRLHCGDVMFTGTTAGVGHEDGRYLEPGMTVTVQLERIGSLTNVVGPKPEYLGP
jgi:2-keto-4-pentenoate hydratase/2-oxohepta-3-ene-1,7-dioic acid hydratase in catechol pathway